MAEAGKSMPDLVRDLTDQVTRLMRDEFALMKAEMNQKVGQAGNGAVMLAVGGVLGLCALLILLMAVVIALANVVAPWLSAVIVAVITGIVAMAVISKGRSNLKTANLTPDRTMNSVRDDARFGKEHVRREQAK